MLGWSEPRRIGRPGIVTSIVSARRRASSSAEPRTRAPLGDRRLDLPRGRAFATAPTFGRSSAGSAADAAQDAGEPALLAEDVELERLDRGDVGRGGERRRRLRRRATRGRWVSWARSTGSFSCSAGRWYGLASGRK